MIGNPADEISQREKRRILREASSYMAHAAANVDEDRGGRYAAIEKPSTVVGAGPVSYPRLPETSPANQAAMVPDEPLIDGTGEGNVLGYRIDDMSGSSSTSAQVANPGTVEDATAAMLGPRAGVAGVKSKRRM